MIAALRRWLRLRRLDRDLNRAHVELQIALRYRVNISTTIDELRVLIHELEADRALVGMNAGSGFRARPASPRVQWWRVWG